MTENYEAHEPTEAELAAASAALHAEMIAAMTATGFFAQTPDGRTVYADSEDNLLTAVYGADFYGSLTEQGRREQRDFLAVIAHNEGACHLDTTTTTRFLDSLEAADLIRHGMIF
ncbi:hypothetical protein [Cryobacterium sp. N22]|uniref:hypothetical protein n=1 Tax=Cryobacterium sp. N22 TaxID=2048290 RepID=UPI000CE4CAE6|nr:hypothetical protein [Cryobacterium sp. N22]